MVTKNTVSATLAALLFAAPAFAAPIDSASSGISPADVTIGFDEVSLLTGDSVTNEFAAFGVTFSPSITYFTRVSARPNFSGAAAITFFGRDVSIKFASAVTDMSAAMTANFGSTTFTALLNGVEVESFTSALDLSVNNFYGFSGSLFDEVRFDPAGTSSVAIDNLAFNIAAIPVPASLPLLAGALGGIALMRRRRAAS